MSARTRPIPIAFHEAIVPRSRVSAGGSPIRRDGQDRVRYAAKLISRFGYLASGLSNADFTPTNQHAEVQKLLAERVRDTVTRFDALVAKDLAGLNDLLKRRNIQGVVAR